jgi:hypothetical protein
VIELYNQTGRVIRRRREQVIKYFLFGNRNENIYDGKIITGTYMIRATVDGIEMVYNVHRYIYDPCDCRWYRDGIQRPFSKFTMLGKCSN